MPSGTLHLGGFPSEILERILGYVGYKGAINLSMASKGFHNLLHKNSDFWKYEVQRFTKASHLGSLTDKAPWQYILQRMIRARVYTWGWNYDGRLGHPYTDEQVSARGSPGPRSDPHTESAVPVPTEVAPWRGRFVVGVEAGGWGVTILTSEGNVYAMGSSFRSPYDTRPISEATEIDFPEPILQISYGLYRAVALSEKGRVYTFGCGDVVAQHVTFNFRTIDYYPGYLRPDKFGKVEEEIGLVRKVVGGWGHSAALISGVGIVIWGTARREVSRVNKHIVPGTNYLENPPRGLPAETLNELQQHRDIGQVLDFAMGLDYLVFVTTRGKVYAVVDLGAAEPIRPSQLHKFSSPVGHSPITRVTCHNIYFAVFNRDGLVHMGSRSAVYGAADLNGKKEPQPLANPDFTGHKVVDIAIGESHCLALTDKGEVLAWGSQRDDECCLGLGDNAALLSLGATRIRTDILVKLINPLVVPFRNPINDDAENGADGKPQELQSEGGISYFALGITAHGPHSGALVLALDEDYALGSCEGDSLKSEPTSDLGLA